MNLFRKKGTFEIFLISVKNLFKFVLSSKLKKTSPFKKNIFSRKFKKKKSLFKKKVSLLLIPIN